MAARLGLPMIAAPTVTDPRVFEALRKWHGDLLVSVSCPQKIPARMVSGFSLGGVNIHSSLLPKFAGLAPYYWALAEGEMETGTSVHYITPKFDGGNILARQVVPILSRDSAFGLFRRLCVAGSNALCEAISLAERGHPGDPQSAKGRSYRSNPDMASYWRMKRNGHAIARPYDFWVQVSGPEISLQQRDAKIP
jgi:methionyl-tRNA formyltransferase